MAKYFKDKEFDTIGDWFFWCYSNLSMAHSAKRDGKEKYEPFHHMIKNKMYNELRNGKKQIASFFEDERVKLENHCCFYCGSTEDLTLDHLIPRESGGSDSGDNIVFACQSCNSSKSDNNLITFYSEKGELPPLLVLRKYLKIVYQFLKENDLLEKPYVDMKKLLPEKYNLELPAGTWPEPKDLRL